MTKKSKTYQLYIALLLCFFQVAGIDVYAQEPVKTVQDSISPVREAPKARARRHREPVVSSPVADSVKVDKAVILPPETRHCYGRQPRGSQPAEPGKDRNTCHSVSRKDR